MIKCEKKGRTMDSRVALISIILKDSGVVEELNDILHQYSQYIIGRMGIPIVRRIFTSSAWQSMRLPM